VVYQTPRLWMTAMTMCPSPSYKRKPRLNVPLRNELPLPASLRYTVNKPQLTCSATISLLLPGLARPILLHVLPRDKRNLRRPRHTSLMIHYWALTSSAAPSHLPEVVQPARHPRRPLPPECLVQILNNQSCLCTRSRNLYPCSMSAGTHSATWLLPRRHPVTPTWAA
jgi:hypothetical protein